MQKTNAGFIKKATFFLTIWALIGFSLGTIILLGPLRSVVAYTNKHDSIENDERIGVIILIILLFFLSYRISIWLMHMFLRTEKKTVKIITLLFPWIACATALFILMHPAIATRNTKEGSIISAQFTIGPYPDEKKLRQLKKEGYTGIISLLHPAVIPFEPKLMSDEKKITDKLGLNLISAPMLPWISDNTKSLEIIKKIIETNTGKYYIHCYLGKDRVNIVKTTIERMSVSVVSENKNPARILKDQQHFERGTVIKIENDVYLTPHPTDDEFTRYILSGNFNAVISLLSPEIPEGKERIEEEKTLLTQYGMAFYTFPITETTTAAEVSRIAISIKNLPKPMIIHHWHTSSTEINFFLDAFRQVTNITASST